MKKSIVLLLFFFISVSAVAQLENIKKVDKLDYAGKKYEQQAYMDAIYYYKKLAEKEKHSIELFKKLGDSYYLNGKLQKANTAYENLFKMKDTMEVFNDTIPAEYYYRYSQTLKSVQDYEKANQILTHFYEIASNDRRAQLFIDNPDFINELLKAEPHYEIKKLNINSNYSDYGPTIFGNKLFFASNRDTVFFIKRLHSWNKQPFSDLYVSTIFENDSLSEPEKFSKDINTHFHESSPTFSPDGKTMYFTRNNFYSGKKGRSEDKKVLLKIYRAKINQKGKWEIDTLPFTSNEYSTAHPSLSADGKTLYFASDMPGGFGQSDLYKVQILPDGNFGPPENLGSDINTEGRETFPFIASNQILYFASDGHLGLGGLDIFSAEKSENSYKIQNLGPPINSPMDDFGFSIILETNFGFFSSNRESETRGDNIYGIKKLIKKEPKKPLPKPVQKPVLEMEPEPIIHKKPKIKVEVGNDLIKIREFNLKNIYFDLDKSEIRPDAAIELEKIVKILNDYPGMEIFIRAHTDSRGSDTYNEALSDRRAKSIQNWLISKGISSDRLTAKGFGEYDLTNHCSNGIPCSPEEHQANRRNEFIVVKL